MRLSRSEHIFDDCIAWGAHSSESVGTPPHFMFDLESIETQKVCLVGADVQTNASATDRFGLASVQLFKASIVVGTGQ